MISETVLITKSEGVTTLVLNRPDKLNSFNEEMHKALYTSMKAASDDPACRAVLLTGAGRAFCAGQDLGDRNPEQMQSPPDLGETLDTYYNPLIRLMRNMDKPIVCAVNGVAAGAGANIALACDLVYASNQAKFIQAFSKIGLVPDSGGTWMLPKLIGEAQAKAYMLLGLPMTATDAADIGMIASAIDAAILMEYVTNIAKQLAAGPTTALAMTKKAIQASAHNSLEEQLDLERDMQRTAGHSKDYAEGVSAFLQKRPPLFTGE